MYRWLRGRQRVKDGAPEVGVARNALKTVARVTGNGNVWQLRRCWGLAVDADAAPRAVRSDCGDELGVPVGAVSPDAVGVMVAVDRGRVCLVWV